MSVISDLTAVVSHQRSLAVVENCLSESQKVLYPKDPTCEIPKLALSFPPFNDLLIHETTEIVKNKYPGLVPITVESILKTHRRLVVISKQLIQEKVLSSLSEYPCELAEGSEVSPPSATHFCTNFNCQELEFLNKLPQKENENGETTSGTDTVKDAHLHVIANGKYGVTRQPLSDANWSQLEVAELQEITELCGPVSIIKPDWGYNDFVTPIDIDMGHMIEAYDLPASWNIDYLKSIWYEYEKKGFKIEVMDSQRAIIVFRNSADAAAALTVMHPSVKTRHGSFFNKRVRQWINERKDHFLPYKQRPRRNPEIAKRLVEQSLGVTPRSSTSKNRLTTKDSYK